MHCINYTGFYSSLNLSSYFSFIFLFQARFLLHFLHFTFRSHIFFLFIRSSFISFSERSRPCQCTQISDERIVNQPIGTKKNAKITTPKNRKDSQHCNKTNKYSSSYGQSLSLNFHPLTRG